MYSKAKIFNLALSALLLTKKVINPDEDTSMENTVLNVNWETAFNMTLADLDLDGTSTQKQLELIEEEPNDADLWLYAYKYPTSCTMIRRIQNGVLMDKLSNQIQRRVAIHDGKKVIFTNEQAAIIEYIPTDFDLKWLSAPAALAIAYKLATLAAPLIAGKGAAQLRIELEQKYAMTKMSAQQLDRLENANFVDPEDQSEFVEARLS